MLDDGLRVKDGRVEADNPESQGDLAAAIANAFTRGANRKPRPVTLSRGQGRTSLLVQITPLVAIRGAKTRPFDTDLPMAMMFVLDPAASLNINAELVSKWFGLSPGEGRVAAEIARGHSPRDAAAKLGLTEGSARVILKRVFLKTNVSRQAELAALVARYHGLTME